MKPFKALSIATALFASLHTVGFSTPVADAEESHLNLGGRIQTLGLAQSVPDEFRDSQRLYLFLRQARLTLSGKSGDYGVNIELAYAGEDEVKAPSPGISLGLLDFNVDVPVGPASLKVGQFKVPYSRERLTSSARLQFADRSINNLAFRVGRDVGVALSTRTGNLTLIGGIFTGGGRDVPERYLPEVLGIPMLVVRGGFDTGVDENVYALTQSEFAPKETAVAFYVNGLFLRDSLIGHSTVLNVKLAEKSLLINGNWNPFIGKAPLVQGDLWLAGADAAVRTPLSAGMSLSAEAELNVGKFSNTYGEISLTGFRAQAGIQKDPVELAIRYALLIPDEAFANNGKAITGSDPIHEITPAVTYSLKNEQQSKVVVDFPVLVNVPVLVEKNLGSYVATEQPDQVTVLKDGSVSREKVFEARLLFQSSF